MDENILSSIESALDGTEEVAESSNEVTEDSSEELDTKSDDHDGDDAQSDEPSDLADILGVDKEAVYVNDNGEVMFNAKVDGQIMPVSLKEMVKSYQLEKHVNNKSMELSARQKEFEEATSKAMEEYTSKLQMADKVVELLEEELYRDIKAANLDELKRVDPQRYLLIREELSSRVSRLKSVKDKLGESTQAEQEEFQRQQVAKFQEIVRSEYEKMISKHPAWADKVVFDKERLAMSTFLKDAYGYNDQEIESIVDHRLIDVIVDAKAYREGQKEASTKLNKSVPKFQKPGSGNHDQLKVARAAKAKIQNFRKSGSQSDLASILMDRL